MATCAWDDMITLSFLLSVISWTLVSGTDPKILSAPSTMDVNVGQSVVFTCDVQHQGGHVVRWTYLTHNKDISQNGELLTARGSRYAIVHPEGADMMWNLMINSVVASDGGDYRCSVDGFPTVQVIHKLVVNVSKPEIPSTIPSVDFTKCCKDLNVSANCLPACMPSSINLDTFDAKTHCRNDLMRLLHCGADGRNHVPCCRRRFVPDHCLDFCVNNPPSISTLGDDYYVCLEAADDIVQCFEEGQFLLPGPPYLLSAHTSGATQIHISWQEPVENEDSVTGYRVYYQKDSEIGYKSTPMVTQTHYILKELFPSTLYNIYVQSINDHGSSLPSMMYRVRTYPDNKPNGVGDAKMLDCCSRRQVSEPCQEMLCSGKPKTTTTSTDMMNCFPEMDKVFACVAVERNHTECCKQRSLPETCYPLCSGKFGATSVDANPLRIMECLTYHMPEINSCFQEGMDTIPGPPGAIHVSDVSPSSAKVEWSAPDSNLASSYLVRYGDINSDKYTEMTVDDTQAELKDLKPGLRYKVEVIAVGEEGMSLASPSILFITYIREGRVPINTNGTTVTAAAPRDILECCKAENVSVNCQQFCDYGVEDQSRFDARQLLECGKFIGQALACGADGRNHSSCCARRSVPNQCLNLCSMTREMGINFEISFDHVVCIQHMAEITDCMEEGKEVLPTAPAKFYVSEVSSNSISLGWSPPLHTAYGITGYVIQYKESETLGPWIYNVNLQPHSTGYIMQNLIPSTKYEVRIMASSGSGHSLPSPIIRQMTAAKTAPLPILNWFNLSAPLGIMDCCEKKNVSQACLPACSGTQVVPVGLCGPDLGKVLSCAADEGDHSVCCNRRNVPRQCTSLCKGKPPSADLSSMMCYAFVDEIMTCFQEGYTQLPSRPKNFQLESQNSRELTFVWVRPDKNWEDVQYRVYFKIGKDSPDINYNFKEDNVQSPYVLDGLQPFTEYSVYVVAMNPKGASLPTSELVVWTTREETPDVNVFQDPDGFLAINSTVKLSCVISGDPSATIQWKRKSVIFSEENTITLAPVQKYHTGRWTCIASNDKASAAHDLILQVQYDPAVTIPKPKVVAAPSGSVPVLQCNFKGFPDEIHWYKGGKEVLTIPGAGHRFRENSKINEDDGEVEAALIVELLTVDDYGLYQCYGKNKYNDITGQIELINAYNVPGATPPPISIPPRVVNVTACCITEGVSSACMEACTFDIDMTLLSKAHEMLHCLPSLPSMVKCAADGRDHSKCCDKKNIPSVCHPLCAGVVPTDDPEVTTCLQYAPGIVDCMEEGHVNIPSQPRDVSARLTSEGHIEVWWRQPLTNSFMVQSYIIATQYSSKTSGQNLIEVKNDPYSPLTKTQLSGIHANADYTIYMMAKNHHGKSQRSNSATVKTFELAPSAPQNLHANTILSRDVTLSWMVPKTHPGAVLYYNVYYSVVGKKYSKQVPSLLTTYKLTNLLPNTKYEMWVTAKSSHYESPRSNTVAKETSNSGKLIGPEGKKSSAGVAVGTAFAVIIILAVAGVAAFYYFRVHKPPIQELKETVSFENPGYATTGEARVHVGMSGMADSNYQPSNGHLSNSSIMKETPPVDNSNDQGYSVSKQNGEIPPNDKEENPYATLDVTHLGPSAEVDTGNVNLAFDGVSKI